MVIYRLNMFQSQICAKDMCDYGGSAFEPEKTKEKTKEKQKKQKNKKKYLASSNVKELFV